MNNFFSKNRFIFYMCNILLILLYLYPGSLLGYLLYNDLETHPQLTPDLIFSTNHLYMFILISVLGYFTFSKENYFNIVILYLIFLSLILEILHVFIPKRGFEFADLFGNILGVIIILIFDYISKKYEKFKK